MGAAHNGASRREVRYFTLSSTSDPWLLARVRWPDVYQAISSERGEWIADPGLFDLPYDRSSVAVSFELAAALPPLSTAALPDFSASPAASTVTLGLAS